MNPKRCRVLRSILPVLTLALLAAPALAAGPSAARTPAVVPGALTADVLLYELPDGTPAGRHELKASFTLRSKTLAVETLSFETVRKGACVVELLAWHPQQRAAVLRLAQDPRNDVRVRITLDGGIEILSADRLVVRTRALQKSGFVPLEARLVNDPATGGPAGLFRKDDRQDCLDYCQAIKDQCDIDCRDQACPGECEYNYENCAAACPQECTGPSSYDYDTTVRESFYQVARSCFDTSIFPPYDPYEFDEFYVTYRTDTHRVTTQCDGSQTDQVISSSHHSGYCWAQQPWTCSPSYGSSWNVYHC